MVRDEVVGEVKAAEGGKDVTTEETLSSVLEPRKGCRRFSGGI